MCTLPANILTQLQYLLGYYFSSHHFLPPLSRLHVNSHVNNPFGNRINVLLNVIQLLFFTQMKRYTNNGY